MKKVTVILATLLALVFCSTAFAAFHETGLPITDEKTSFSMLVDDSYTAEDHKVIYDMLEEQTNVHVDLQLFPYETAREKLNVMLSTGDYPDVIAGWLLGTKDILELGMDEGTFKPLEALIDKYCPTIKEVLDKKQGEHTVRESMTLPDGHIYTIPYLTAEPKVTFKPYINQKWLDNLGLKMPTTPAELKEVLIAFRDKDANGNGNPNDEIPFSGDPNNLNLGMLAGWFGVDGAANTDYPYFEIKDGKLHFTANTPEFRKFLEYFHDLYQEKLIDPEIFTQDLEQWKAKGKKDLYGVSIAYGPGDFIEDYKEHLNPEEYKKYGNNQFHALPVLKGCDKPIFHRNSYGDTLFRTQAAITDKCSDEKAAIILRWFDNLYQEENSVQSQSGKLGVSIEKLRDGLYRQFDTREWPEEKRQANDWGHIFTQSLPRYYHDAKVIAFDKEDVEESDMDKWDKLYEPFLNETFPKIWPTDQKDIDRSSILTTDINTEVKKMIAQFVSGEKPLNDQTWAEYCKSLDRLGLPELIEINCRVLGMEPYKGAA